MRWESNPRSVSPIPHLLTQLLLSWESCVSSVLCCAIKNSFKNPMRLYQKILLVLQKPGEGDKGRQSQSRRPGLEGVQARSEAPKAEPVEALQLYKSQQRPQGRVTEGSCWLESPPPRGMDGLTTATRVKRAGEGQPPGGSRGPPDPENISVCPQAALWPPWVLGTADHVSTHSPPPARPRMAASLTTSSSHLLPP